VNKVAVLYCLRQEDGITAFKKFIEALTIFPIEPAKLHILLKTVDANFVEEVRLSLARASLDANVHLMPNWGFDLGTYKMFIENSQDVFFILMSASSLPTRSDWVRILTAPLISNTSGLVGSMASWESLSTNVFASYSFGIEMKIQNFYRDFLDHKSNSFIEFFFYPIRLVFSFLVCRQHISKILSKFGAILFFLLHPRVIWRRFTSFPKFPNPHIRTTGMVISKELFLEVCSKIPINKIDSMLMESGTASITKIATTKGINPLVVVGDEYFSPNDERVRKNFRSADCVTPLVTDHHYREFRNGSPDFQTKMYRLTWGPDDKKPFL
jgi:hypothetical protein